MDIAFPSYIDCLIGLTCIFRPFSLSLLDVCRCSPKDGIKLSRRGSQKTSTLFACEHSPHPASRFPGLHPLVGHDRQMWRLSCAQEVQNREEKEALSASLKRNSVGQVYFLNAS